MKTDTPSGPTSEERPSNTESVSVVLATYNGEQYLSEQLASLSAQLLRPIELVVGDDGSTDSTIAIVTEFAQTSPFPVHLIRRTQRLGFADNFLSTALSASGSLLAFCDQDDVWHANKLARVTDTFAQSPAIVAVAHDAVILTADDRRLPVTSFLSGLPGRYPRGVSFPPPRGCALTIRRWLLDWVDPAIRPDFFNPAIMPHDHWLWMIATCIGDRVVLPDRLMSYRRHSSSVGGSLPRTRVGRLTKDLGDRFPFLRPENVDRLFTGVSASSAHQADYLDRMAEFWTQEGHREWSAAAGNQSAELRRISAQMLDRVNLFRLPNRRTAATHWAHMVYSGRYDRPQSAVMDALRVMFGPRAATRGG